MTSFWGVELQAGHTYRAENTSRSVVNITKISLGEVKDNENSPVQLFLRIQGERRIIGTLSREFPNISCDLLVNGSFELCHDGKSEVVYFCGTKCTSKFIFGTKWISKWTPKLKRGATRDDSSDDDDETEEWDDSSDDDDETEEYDSDELQWKWPSMNVFTAESKKDKTRSPTKNLRPGKQGKPMPEGPPGKKGGGCTTPRRKVKFFCICRRKGFKTENDLNNHKKITGHK